jgi:hypothetical protein
MELEDQLNFIEEQKMSILRELSQYKDNLNTLYTHHLNIVEQVNERLKNENSLLRESSNTRDAKSILDSLQVEVEILLGTCYTETYCRIQ